ncbi:MAG: nitrilase family protein, partial [Sinomicrobium sp.]|nr:nitrilase family protein [Sinomicrobium sp.]
RNTVHYDALIYVASWPEPRIAAWDALLKARAIENMAYCIGVNRTGIDGNGHNYPGHSAVYDVLGNRLVFSDREEILYATLHKEHIRENREKFRFLADGDSFVLT